MRIKFFTTGGNIDKVYFDARSEYQVGAPQVTEILKNANVAFEYEVVSILQKDSLDMTTDDREAIRRAVAADPNEKIVVTHGTDTMADTARHLIGLAGKTIVFTGALEPARSRYTDATFNVGCAIAAAQTLPPGVYIAMNGRCFVWNRVKKNRETGVFEAL